MPNALAAATSPYLRQHQFNPVQWLPWSDVVLERAQREGKPILLSIGYAACHWCHVMARESFEDPEVAALMNEHFVNIKVDREERPDVDAIYLRALQAMGTRAGWPLTMFLTPTGKPFWGGTYFPKEGKGQQISFREVLVHISAAYRADPAKAEEKAAAVIDVLRNTGRADRKDEKPSSDGSTTAARDLLRNVDMENGGLTGAPKFPYPALLRLLWNTGCRTANREMKDVVLLTLNKMIAGGIFDQLGGGFSRYAVDGQWRVPHFEKMLYDNALLVHLLADVWRIEPVAAFRNAAERTVDWVFREMGLPSGAFASSLDAESGNKEGGFYLWHEREIDELLGSRAARFKRAYGVTSAGNFEGRNVLYRVSPSSPSNPYEESELAGDRDVLFQARSARPSPRRDDKVLADWNGMMSAALARAAIVFDRPEWLDAAQASFDFVADQMASGDSLHHSWCDGELSAASILDDYAQMSLAAVTLFESTGDTRFLDQGKAWVARCLSLFKHPQHGALYYTASDRREFFARICDGRDSATPSGNGVMAHVVARLHYLTGEESYRRHAEALVAAFAHAIGSDSYQLATLVDASEFLCAGVQICVVGRRSEAGREKLFIAAHRHGGVDQVVMLLDDTAVLPTGHPAYGKVAVDGKPTAYVCIAGTCLPPVFDEDTLGKTLNDLASKTGAVG